MIDPDGFTSVELRELRGKYYQQVLLFTDAFTNRASDPACDNDGDGLNDFDGRQSIWGACTGIPGGCPAEVSDPNGDGVAEPDPQCVNRPWRNNERPSRCGLGFELALILAPLAWLRRRRLGGGWPRTRAGAR